MRCREICGDEPFCAKRPFSSEGDEEKRTWWCRICDGHQAHIGTRRGWSTHALHMETGVFFQAVGVATIYSNVLDHSEKDIIFCLLLRKTREKPDYHE